MTTQAERKALVRSWLYRLLSEVEVSHIVNAEESSTGHLITIRVLFGTEPEESDHAPL